MRRNTSLRPNLVYNNGGRNIVCCHICHHQHHRTFGGSEDLFGAGLDHVLGGEQYHGVQVALNAHLVKQKGRSGSRSKLE